MSQSHAAITPYRVYATSPFYLVPVIHGQGFT
jgi:hypothetical protein